MKKLSFITNSLNKKKVATILFFDAVLDFISYFIPFAFTLYLKQPFTVEKGLIVVGLFIFLKIITLIGNNIIYRYLENYIYEFTNLQYENFYKELSKLPTETISKYQTGYFDRIIGKLIFFTGNIISSKYIGIVVSFYFLFYTFYKQSIYLLLIAIITVTILILLSVYLQKKAKKQLDELYEKEYEYSSIYLDFISNIRTVKLLNNIDYFVDVLKKQGSITYQGNSKYIRIINLEKFSRGLLIFILFSLGLLKALYDLSNGIDTLGVIVFYIAMSNQMNNVIQRLTKTIIDFFQFNILLQKVKEIFISVDNRRILNRFKSLIIKDITISYPNTNLEIKINDFIVNPGDKISITGKSGQGKTSFLNLILGNISSYSGDVLIDNKNLKDYKLDFGVVSQEIELFNVTIKENLCLGNKISDEELEKYLKELDLGEIFLFENGLNTIVGEKGLKLSTGQKRRINILRSYLMNKDIYILDEPTSNLDKQTEEIVVKFILKYFKDKTLIITTHNDKINEVCNKFYIFKDHKLVEKTK